MRSFVPTFFALVILALLQNDLNAQSAVEGKSSVSSMEIQRKQASEKPVFKTSETYRIGSETDFQVAAPFEKMSVSVQSPKGSLEQELNKLAEMKGVNAVEYNFNSGTLAIVAIRMSMDEQQLQKWVMENLESQPSKN